MATVCSARVRDTAVREAAGGILKMAFSLATPLRRKGSDLDQSRENAEDIREELIAGFDRVNDMIGELLRDLY